jgi:hypothetical protein
VIRVFDARTLADLARPDVRERALETLESGGVVHLPHYSFDLTAAELPMVDPARIVSLRRGKPRASGRPTLLFHQPRGWFRGGHLRGVPRRDLEAVMGRFADWAREAVFTLLPDYRSALEQEFTTFRPCERTKRQALHIDAVPRRPTQGRAMLRIFSNVNGAGVPRVWQVGEGFEANLAPFVRRLPAEIPRRPAAADWLWYRCGISTGPETDYDSTMRALRDLMTHDREYQRNVERAVIEFPSGSTWMALTDIALHSALAGQHGLDQTFLLSTSAMHHPEKSSLQILERLVGRSLHGWPGAVPNLEERAG